MGYYGGKATIPAPGIKTYSTAGMPYTRELTVDPAGCAIVDIEQTSGYTTLHVASGDLDGKRVLIRVKELVGDIELSASEPNLELAGDWKVHWNANHVWDGAALELYWDPARSKWVEIARHLTFNDARGDGATSLGRSTYARGRYSVAAGQYTYADGDYSITAGRYIDADSGCSQGFGQDTDANGERSAAFGYGSQADGEASMARGLDSLAHEAGQVSLGGKAFLAAGDCQSSRVVISREVTGSGSWNLLVARLTVPVVPDGMTWAFRGLVAARQTGGTAGTAGDSKAWEIKGCCKVADGLLYLVGSPSVNALGSDSGASAWSVSVAVNGASTRTLGIRGQGEADKTIHWACELEVVQVG